MKLIKLTTRGWRRFLDESTIEFSQDENKPVTLIHGENGAGKTALLNAILWCTTGKTSPRLNARENLQYESDELGGKSDECYVTLTFEHDGFSWLAKRTIDRGLMEFQLGKKNPNGTYDFLSRSMSQKEMNLILPPEMATYFFFDGEGFNEGQSHSDRTFASSVKNILGFEFANRTLQEIEDVQRYLTKEINKINSKAQSSASAARELQKATEKLANSEKELAAARRRESDAQDAIDEAKAKMDAFGHEAIQERQADIDKFTSELLTKEAERTSAEQGLKGLVRKYAALTFSLALAKDGREVLKARRKAGQYPAKFQRPLILELLELNSCICGSHPLSEEQIKTLKAKLDEAGTEIEADRISLADAKASLNLNEFSEFEREHSNYRHIIEEKTREITATQAEITRLENEQTEFNEEEFNIYKAKWNSERDARGQAQFKILELTKDINYQKTIISKSKPENLPPGDQLRLDRMQASLKKLQRVYDTANAYLEKTVISTANQIAALMRHDLRRTDVSHKIDVNPNSLKFAYVDSRGREVGESTGEGLFLNLSFASALSKIAAIRSKIKNGILVPGAVGPLVVDAPFGDLDPTNARIIYEVLKESTDQLVLLLSRSHWQPLDEVMRPSLGHEYILVRQHAQSADDEQEVKEINIEGKVYPLVSHDFDYPTTLVERIK